jgi:hypothetical protein
LKIRLCHNLSVFTLPQGLRGVNNGKSKKSAFAATVSLNDAIAISKGWGLGSLLKKSFGVSS